MSMVGYAVKRLYDGISIINHHPDGTQTEAMYYAEDVPELVALLQHAYGEWRDEIVAEMAAEAEQLAEAEGGGVRQRETELELKYSDQGHDAY